MLPALNQIDHSFFSFNIPRKHFKLVLILKAIYSKWENNIEDKQLSVQLDKLDQTTTTRTRKYKFYKFLACHITLPNAFHLSKFLNWGIKESWLEGLLLGTSSWSPYMYEI